MFAEIVLDRDELSLYDRVYETMAVEAPVPDLVVYLQAPVDTLLFRVARRGIRYEQRIGRRYLERLAEAYARFFHDYAEAPLLIVNAATIDPINNDNHYQMLLEQIERTRSGRHFFNPLVSARVFAWIRRHLVPEADTVVITATQAAALVGTNGETVDELREIGEKIVAAGSRSAWVRSAQNGSRRVDAWQIASFL